MTTMPIISMELEGIKEQIKLCLIDNHKEIDKQVQKHVDAFCTAKNLDKIIKSQTEIVVKKAVEDAITNYFSYGKGYKEITNVVNENIVKKLEK